MTSGVTSGVTSGGTSGVTSGGSERAVDDASAAPAAARSVDASAAPAAARSVDAEALEKLRAEVRELRLRYMENQALLEGYREAMLHRSFAGAAVPLLDCCLRLTGATAGTMSVARPGGESLVLGLEIGAEPLPGDAAATVALEGARAVAYRDGRVVAVDRPTSADGALRPRGDPPACALFAPLVTGEGAIGLVGLYDKPGCFDDADARAMAEYAGMVAWVLDHHRALERLERSEQRFRSVVETAREAILTIDSEARIVTWNRGAEALFGWPASEAVGQSLLMVIPAAKRALHTAAIRAAAAGTGPAPEGSRVVTGLTRDGAELPIEVSFSSFQARDGLFFTAIARDVSVRQRAEEALAAERAKQLRATEALAASEARYRHIVETASEGIWIFDRDAVTSFVNPRMAEMLGYAVEEMVGRPMGDFVQPEHLEAAVADFEQRRQGVAAHKPVRLRHRDGSTVWTNLSARPIVGEDGCFEGVLGMLTDVTESRRLEEQLRQSQKMEAVGRLAGGVAHDFNNVLSVIVTFAGAIGSALGPDDPLRGDVEEILTAAARAGAITRQLLALGRREVLDPQVVRVADLLAGMENMLRRFLGDAVRLTLRVAGDPGSVLAGPGELDQVVLNLALNARDAMPEGGDLVIEADAVELGREQAELVTLAPGPYVRIAVSDSGSGIAPEAMEHVFEPFFTTKAESKGTGLGLATVYGIVKQAHGHVEARSTPGRGTRFEVLLPRA